MAFVFHGAVATIRVSDQLLATMYIGSASTEDICYCGMALHG